MLQGEARGDNKGGERSFMPTCPPLKSPSHSELLVKHLNSCPFFSITGGLACSEVLLIHPWTLILHSTSAI